MEAWAVTLTIRDVIRGFLLFIVGLAGAFTVIAFFTDFSKNFLPSGTAAKAADAVKNAKNSTKLLCGAGIVSGEDVAKAIELGSKGILVASGIIKANDWNKIINDFAKSMV